MEKIMNTSIRSRLARLASHRGQLALLALGAVALGACAASTEAVDSVGSAVTGERAVSAPIAAGPGALGSAPSSAPVLGAGPVTSSPKIFALYWGNFTGSQIATNQAYLEGLAGYASGVAAPGGQAPTMSQYGVVGATVIGSYVDSSIPSGSIGESDVIAHIASLQPTHVPAADPATLVMVFTSGISFDDGYAGSYCGYHDHSGNTVFSLNPYPSASDCGQGGWSGLTEVAVWQAQTSHEFQEAATDPFPFSGWTEIGDACNWGISASNVTAMSFGAVQMVADGNTMTCSNFTPDDQPAIFVRSTGEADVVRQGADGSLVYDWAMPGGAWNTHEIAGPNTTFSPASIYVRSTGEADVVAMGPNNSLMYYYAFPGGGWSQAQIAGAGTTFSAPQIVVRSTGEADIVAMGASGSLDYYYATPGSAWHQFTIAGSGSTFSAPAIFVRSSGEADVVAMGANNSLAYYYATPGSAWHASTIAGNDSTFSAPSIFVRSSGEADVVAMGANNTLAYHYATPGSSWTSATVAGVGTTFSTPAIFVRSTGEADIVARGAGGALDYYHATPGSAWSANVIAGGRAAVSAPSIFVRSTGEADVVVEGPSLAPEYYYAWPGTGWSVGSP
jgi:hypothetical protein